MVQQVVTEAPGIIALKPNADNTLTISGSTGTICAAVVVSNKGPVGKPFIATGENSSSLMGKPLHMSEGLHAEGLRHISQALKECSYGYFVRAIADDARFPSISIGATTTKDDHAYGTDVSVGTDFLTVWPKDGDPSTKRRISVKKLSGSELELTFEESVNNEWVNLDGPYDVSLNPEDRDASGLPMFAESVLQEQSAYFDCAVSPNADLSAFTEELEIVFEGGTNGGTPTEGNYKDAWSMLSNEEFTFDIGFSAGIYDPVVIAHALDVCDKRLAQFKFDLPPWMTEVNALAWLDSANIAGYSSNESQKTGGHYQALCIHYPYKRTDEWYGGKSIWGASGDLVAAKARCFATVTSHAQVKGAHFSAAGPNRGYIDSRGVKPIHSAGFLTNENRAKARINTAVRGRYIGDVLNLYKPANDLRFEHVTAIHNVMMRDFIEASSYAQFEHDGSFISTMTRLGNEIVDRYVTAGALVQPRDPRNGTEPARFVLEQQELDLWKITLYYANTGVARRIAIQPNMVK